ncbi:MAG TPA: ParB/RepB/Spo0J family partition protein [Actinomycetota bacterium]|nr:ParB/RepB/Spo0J family partition protein [Actinomycetota bacterium]
MSKRGGLGRGLSALIPGAPETGEGVSGLLEVPVHAVTPNPKQPRTHWDEEEIQALAASIREVGILQPIVVRSADEGYELVAGERRLRAAKVAGLATVPVVLRETDDADLLREALIENIHRQDLGPIELAEAFRQLLEDLGLKQEDLAERVGVSRSHIANTIRLLQLPIETQQLLTDSKIQAGHARALLALGEADSVNTLALRVAAEDLSVRETEDLVRRYLEPPAEQRPASDVTTTPATDPGMAEVEEILSEQLATRVLIQYGKKRGRVVIEFGSVDDLERIVSEIVGSGPGLSPD